MKIEHDISGARFRCDYCPVLDELCEIRKNLEIEETVFLTGWSSRVFNTLGSCKLKCFPIGNYSWLEVVAEMNFLAYESVRRMALMRDEVIKREAGIFFDNN